MTWPLLNPGAVTRHGPRLVGPPTRGSPHAQGNRHRCYCCLACGRNSRPCDPGVRSQSASRHPDDDHLARHAGGTPWSPTAWLFAISPGFTSSAAGQNSSTWGVSTGFTFPVTKITKKGVIRHEGAMVFTNGPKARTVVVSSPRLEQSTKTITAVVSGVDPSLDGKRLPVMIVKNLKSKPPMSTRPRPPAKSF